MPFRENCETFASTFQGTSSASSDNEAEAVVWPIIVPQQKFERDPKWWVASLDLMAKTNYGLWSLGRKACKTDLAGYSSQVFIGESLNRKTIVLGMSYPTLDICRMHNFLAFRDSPIIPLRRSPCRRRYTLPHET